ncbi:MAG: rhomboid family intramembrane serine protease [Armatimonadetes bacterium]|nr:rhomboid family intramembrane serine protease [Armatimonadota bacterium]
MAKTNPKTRFPLVTLILLGICLAAGFWVVWSPDVIERFGFRANSPTLLTAIFCLFLHGNLFHLLGNMLGLTILGSWVEDAVGWWKYLLLFFGSGLAGVGMHWLVLRQSADAPPLIGASGAVAGFVALGAVRYMWSRVPLFPGLRVPVIGFAGIWALLQGVGAFVKLNSMSGVSFWSHLGGFAIGLMFAALYRAPKEASRHRGHRSMKEMGERSPAAIKVAAQLVIKDHPEDVHAWEQFADASEMLEDRESELDARLRLLDFGGVEDLGYQVERLNQLGALGKLSTIKRMKLTTVLTADEPETAIALLESVVHEPEDDPRKPEAMVALADLLKTKDPTASKLWIEQLKSNYSMDPAMDLARSRGLLD